MKKLKTLLQSNYFYGGLFLVLIIYLLITLKGITYQTKFSQDTHEIVAKIVSYKSDGDKLSLYLKEREVFVATYYFKTLAEKENIIAALSVGKTLKLTGNLTEIKENTIPNTFNYKKYLYHHRIYASFTIENLEVMSTPISFWNRVRESFQKRILKLGNNAYLQAFILGDKSLMNSEMQDVIQENGVSHLFALSGMHLSFFVLILNKILKKVKFKKVIIYLFLLFYLILADFPVSLIRAILLMLFIDLNNKGNLGLSKVKCLLLIASGLLFYNPFYLYDLGFLYSFVVTFSLLFTKINCQHKFLQIVAVSTITFLFSLPITVYSNYEINILAILNNIILVPFVSNIIFPCAILTFCCSLFLPVFNLLISILESINQFLSNFAIYIIIGKINYLEIGLYYLILMLLIKSRSKKIAILMSIYLVFLSNKDLFNFNTSLYFLDVGQGDSALLVTPQNKKAILIDTGGIVTYEKEDWQKRAQEYHLSDNIILFLKSMSIHYIDTLVLTHGDYDHMGEASHLVNNFKINKVIFNQGDYNDLEIDLINILNQKQIKYYQNLESLQVDSYVLQLLNTKEYDNENDNSNVIYFNINNYQFLLMGDAGVAKEKDILAKYDLKDIDFLKVGHHGSDTSSSKEFIDKINPKYAFISVGANNRYGHPKESVLKVLANRKVYRTDQDGTIELILNKKGYKIKLFKNQT